jgi:hypothetical protein
VHTVSIRERMSDDTTPKDTKNPLEELADDARARAARATADAAIDAAGAAASRLAHGMLDGLETLMFGKVGAAEDAAKKDEGDPLERLRGRYTSDAKPKVPAAPPAVAAPKLDPVAQAQKELEALKAARKAPAAEVKKTL